MKRYMEVHYLYEYFHERKAYPYKQIIQMKLNYYQTRLKEKNPITPEEKKKISQAVKVPLYAYIVYLPVLFWRIARKVLGKNK